MNKFIDYNTYLLEYQTYDIKYFYHIENKYVLHILAASNDICVGYISFWKYNKNEWEAVSVAAEKGFGYKMFEVGMDFIYPNWFIPIRNKSITHQVIKTIERFIDRPDIETQAITPDDSSYTKISDKYNNWFNRRYRLKDKLNFEFEKANYKFIEKNGVNLFSKKYPWTGETMLK